MPNKTFVLFQHHFFFPFTLGVIQKPRGHNFALFSPPTYPRGHFLCTERGQKWQILDQYPPSVVQVVFEWPHVMAA